MRNHGDKSCLSCLGISAEIFRYEKVYYILLYNIVSGKTYPADLYPSSAVEMVKDLRRQDNNDAQKRKLPAVYNLTLSHLLAILVGSHWEGEANPSAEENDEFVVHV